MKKKIFFLQSIIFLFLFTCFLEVQATDCPQAVAGNYTLESSCIIPEGTTMSVLEGGLTINPGVTLTLNSNSRLTFTPGYMLISLNGTISLANGATILEKSHYVELNSASASSCNSICLAVHPGTECTSIGQDSYAVDTYYWRSTACSDGSCEYIVGYCGTIMISQCSPANTCCSIETYWTRCLCVDE